MYKILFNLIKTALVVEKEFAKTLINHKFNIKMKQLKSRDYLETISTNKFFFAIYNM